MFKFFQKHKKVFGIVLSAILACTMAICAFADSTDPTAGESAITATTSAVSSALADFNATNLTSVIVAGLAIAIPLILCWFAFRWIWRKAKGALYGG